MDNIEILKSGGIDCDGAIRRFAGQTALFVKYIKTYPSNSHMVDDYLNALEQKEYENAHFNIHSIKGIAANLGINSVADICQLIVNALRAEDYDALPALNDKLVPAQKAVEQLIASAGF
jgi:HPt (histidine-containing phosphotransfer) domain-containing protein